ncbi:hypothetical protein Golax_015448 [Gossypium laxum]|uniref:Uncharacterized protein n=1 Tax=Gossypium laxum TaxID=34288 RepID=A0A7J8ZZ95_9ROSI|nr:hypothetical protein [Gossypium laxum]
MIFVDLFSLRTAPQKVFQLMLQIMEISIKEVK